MRRPAASGSLGHLRLAAAVLLLGVAGSGASAQEPPPPRPPRVSPAQLEADGWTRLCRFRGRFVSGGLPREAARAIPLDGYDLRFLLVVRVEQLLEGKVPEPWQDEIVFAVHSPSLFFRLRLGLRSGEGRFPEEELLFGLWRKGGAYRLEAERIPTKTDPR